MSPFLRLMYNNIPNFFIWANSCKTSHVVFCDQLCFQSCCCTQFQQAANAIFMITAEIHACSLANFYCQYADRHMNLKFMRRVSEREPAIRQFVIVKNKLMSVFNASVLLLIMNFVITFSSTRLSPRGSTATLTMWWRNSWSITGQMHKKLMSIC